MGWKTILFGAVFYVIETTSFFHWDCPKPMFSCEPNSKKVLQYSLHRILRYVHGILNVDEKKLVVSIT